VGRDAELGQLIASLDGLVKGKGSAWLIGGESGVGKSRLLDELRIRALVEGVLVLRGQAVEGGGLPYQLWRDPMRRLVTGTELSDLEAGVLKPLVPDLSTLLNRSVPDAPELDARGARQRLSLTIMDVFKRQKQPVVLILEDLHWASESLEPLRQLNLFVDEFPWLIVAGYRDDEMPTLLEAPLPDDLPGMTVMRLGRLNDHEIGQLSTRMLGEIGQQPALLDLLKRETEGNIFFMVEVLRTLAEDAGRLSEIGNMTLPNTVAASGVIGVVRRRLDRLPEAVYTWLKQTAVIGREPDMVVLRTIHETSETAHQSVSQTLDTLLTLCASAAVLEIVDGNWRFAHDKIRETVLTDLTADERIRLHRRAAETIEQVYPEDIAYAEVLLEHWYIAGDTAKTLHYTVIAGERLVIYSAEYDTAKRLLERGLNLVEDLPAEQRGSIPARLAWLLAVAYMRQGDYSSATQYYQDSLKLAEGDHQVMVDDWNGLSDVENRRGNYAAAQDAASQALTLAEKAGNQKGMAASLNGLGVAADLQGDYAAARTYYEQTVALCREIGDQRGLAIGLNNLGNIISDQGDYATAINYYEQSLAIRRSIGDRSGIAACLNNLGIAAYDLGDYAATQAYQEQSLAIRQEIKDRPGIAVSLNNLAVVASDRGDYATAQAYDEQSLAIKREIGDQAGVAMSLHNLGGTAYSVGDYVTSQTYHEQSLMLRRELGDQVGVATSLTNLGRTELAQHNLA
ncbi:MAG TPA: tetratricopeptide repeat protein, partial [Phototrophicaceae bacterium]|nr:tetratricopeptide repeat protein [Phototrophicaceae bacterium]